MSATQESNKDIVRQHLAAFNDRDKEAFSDLLADDVVEHGIHEKLEGDEEILEFLDRHGTPPSGLRWLCIGSKTTR